MAKHRRTAAQALATNAQRLKALWADPHYREVMAAQSRIGAARRRGNPVSEADVKLLADYKTSKPRFTEAGVRDRPTAGQLAYTQTRRRLEDVLEARELESEGVDLRELGLSIGGRGDTD